MTSSVTYAAVAYRGSGWTQAVPAAAAGPVQVARFQPSSNWRCGWRARRSRATSPTGRVLSPAELFVPANGRFQERLAVFVTLTKNGELRGCIGHIEAVQELWRDIRDNAIAAAVEDPRFPHGAARRARRIAHRGECAHAATANRGARSLRGRPARHHPAGSRPACSVFLPQVAPEQGWDRDQTLDHLARKPACQRAPGGRAMLASRSSRRRCLASVSIHGGTARRVRASAILSTWWRAFVPVSPPLPRLRLPLNAAPLS